MRINLLKTKTIPKGPSKYNMAIVITKKLLNFSNSNRIDCLKEDLDLCQLLKI